MSSSLPSEDRRPAPTRLRTMFAAATGVVALAVAAALFAFSSPGSVSADEAMSREELEKIIHEYIVNNPEVLVEAMDRLEAKRAAERTAAAAAAMTERRDEIENDGYSYVGGNPAGDVTVVEFFDYRCGHCKNVRPEVLRLLEEDKGVRLVLKEFPILSQASVNASKAAMAALAQGNDKYWSFHNALMAEEGALDDPRILELASASGLDIARLQTDMQDPVIVERITKTHELAQALGVDGTPAFVIGDKLYPGEMPFDDLKSIVDAARTQ